MSMPYFKFLVTDYLSGKIQRHNMETQGVFMNICALLWKNKGELYYDIDELSHILRVEKQLLTNCLTDLIDKGLIKKFASGLLAVCFIDEQLKDRKILSITRSVAGRKGGKHLLSKSKASACNQNQSQSQKLKTIIKRNKIEVITQSESILKEHPRVMYMVKAKTALCNAIYGELEDNNNLEEICSIILEATKKYKLFADNGGKCIISATKFYNEKCYHSIDILTDTGLSGDYKATEELKMEEF